MGGAELAWGGDGGGKEGGGDETTGVHTRPALPCPGAAPAQRGGGGIPRPHPRPGRSARLSPAIAAAHAPCAVPATGGLTLSAAARLRLGSAPALVAATVAAPQSRLWLPATPPPVGPRRGSASAPARRANQARHRPSRHRPARRTAGCPKFEQGPAGACQPVRAQDAPRLALLLASPGGPPTHTWKAKG